MEESNNYQKRKQKIEIESTAKDSKVKKQVAVTFLGIFSTFSTFIHFQWWFHLLQAWTKKIKEKKYITI